MGEQVAGKVDPYAAVFGSAMSAAMGGPSSAAADSRGQVGGAGFDNSGWNITFGDNSGIQAERTQTAPMDKTMQYVLIGGGLLLAVLWLKKSKK